MPVIFFSSDDVGDSLSVCGFFFVYFFARDFSSTCSLSCRSTTCFFSELAGERGGKHRWLSEAGQIGQEPKKKTLEAAFSREHIIFTSENVEQRRSGWFDE